MRIYISLGITLAVCGIARASLTSTFTYTSNSVQTFSALQNGEYDITVYGAAGGNGYGNSGGEGAETSAYFDLTANESLNIYVGQAGSNTSEYGGGGGGGGSFVLTSLNAPLIIAGGGGGGGGYAVSQADGGPGLTGRNGGAGYNNGSFGTSGAGGGGGTASIQNGGGGTGFFGNGGNGSGPASGAGGLSYANGFNGGGGGAEGGSGGYGGGGGGGNLGAGGGGGYSGGAGGQGSNGYGYGGGGGSYVDVSAIFEAFALAGENSGNGMVVITYEGPEDSILSPEPSSSATCALGLLTLLLAVRKLRSTV